MLKALFLHHPAKVGESYGEHLVFAFGFGLRLVRAGLAAMVHGVVPALHETTASSEILAMAEDIQVRRARMAGNVAARG